MAENGKSLTPWAIKGILDEYFPYIGGKDGRNEAAGKLYNRFEAQLTRVKSVAHQEGSAQPSKQGLLTQEDKAYLTEWIFQYLDRSTKAYNKGSLSTQDRAKHIIELVEGQLRPLLTNEDLREKMQDLYCIWCPHDCRGLTRGEKLGCLASGGFADAFPVLLQSEIELVVLENAKQGEREKISREGLAKLRLTRTGKKLAVIETYLVALKGGSGVRKDEGVSGSQIK